MTGRRRSSPGRGVCGAAAAAKGGCAVSTPPNLNPSPHRGDDPRPPCSRRPPGSCHRSGAPAAAAGPEAQPGAVRPGVRGEPRGGAGTHGRWPGDCDDPHRRRDRAPQHPPAVSVAGLGGASRRLGGVRQLHRLPPPRWLRAQPRCGRGAAGALAGALARTTPRLPALVPRPGGGAGELLRSRRLLRRS